jgi:hypothetical protein
MNLSWWTAKWNPLRSARRIALALPLAALFAVGWLGWRSEQGFLVEIRPSQVGVRIDYLRGRVGLLSAPGYHVVVPWFQEVVVLERSPLEVVVSGELFQGKVPTGPSVVRARDGSRFWFEDLGAQVQLVPEHAPMQVELLGASSEREAEVVRASLRLAMRDAYGKLAAQEAADPAETEGARLACRATLADVLVPFGLEVLQVPAPRVRFERAYEQVIAQREVKSAELEQLSAKAADLLADRVIRMEQVENELELKRRELASALRRKQTEAEGTEEQRRSEVDAVVLARASATESEALKLELQAETLTLTYETGAAGLREQVAALAGNGHLAVVDELARRIGEVKIALAPSPVVAGEKP